MKWTRGFHKQFLDFVPQKKSLASAKSTSLKLEGTCLMAPAGKRVKKRGKSHFGSKSQTLHSHTEKSNSDLPDYLIAYLDFIRPGEEKGGELSKELSSFKSASFGYWQTEVLATTGFLSCPQKTKNKKAKKNNPKSTKLSPWIQNLFLSRSVVRFSR